MKEAQANKEGADSADGSSVHVCGRRPLCYDRNELVPVSGLAHLPSAQTHLFFLFRALL